MVARARSDAARQVLTVCGSIQPRSANRSALDVVRAMLRSRPGVEVEGWRRRLGRAHAVVIAAPEYAGALAGTIKNALD